jgi:hypothetical protein
MLLQESGRQGWRVVATDVSSASLERAASGLYEVRELAGLSTERRQRFVEREDGRWRIVQKLRERVTFAPHNLMNEPVPRPARSARAVLCRNVLIYLRPEVQHAFLDRVADEVNGLDVLFLGATESLYGVTERFIPVRVGAAYAYRVAGRPSPARSQPAAPRSAARPPRPVVPVPTPVPPALDAPGYMAEGQVALAAGRLTAAVTAFRGACYLDADNPLAQLNLGLALDASGHAGEARRAFAAARAALLGSGVGLVEAELEGFSGTELADLIERRLRPVR